MNCTKAEKQFSAYSEKDLSPKARLQLEQHLRECESCAYEWLAFQRTLSAVKDMPVIAPSADFDWRLRLRLLAIEDADKVALRQKLWWYLRNHPIWAFNSVLAFLIVLSVGLYFYLSTSKFSTSDEFLVRYVMPEISSKESIEQWSDFDPEAEERYSLRYLSEFNDSARPTHKNVKTNYILRTVSFTSDNVNKPF